MHIIRVITIQPEGQEHSPVTWWHTPPFWQGQRSSHCCPCLPGGHRSSQLHRNNKRRIMRLNTLCAPSVHAIVYHNDFSEKIGTYIWLTMLQYIQGCMCTPLWRGGRWHCFGTGISVGSCYHRCLAHSAPHTASHGSQLCIYMLQWWGYTVLHFYTDTGYCSEDPSDYCHMLERKHIQRSGFQCLRDIS